MPTNSATECLALPATAMWLVNRAAASRGAWSASTCPSLSQWPGTVSAGGRGACSEICMPMVKKASVSIPNRNPSCSAGPRASARVRSSRCLRRNSESRACRLVLLRHPVDQRLDRLDAVNAADALPGAPDVAPRLEFRVAAGAEIHFRLVGLGKIVGVEAGARHAAAQVIAGDAAEQRSVDDVLAPALDEHLLVLGAGVGFLRGDEAGAEIGQIGTQRPRGQDVGTGAHGARQDVGS